MSNFRSVLRREKETIEQEAAEKMGVRYFIHSLCILCALCGKIEIAEEYHNPPSNFASGGQEPF